MTTTDPRQPEYQIPAGHVLVLRVTRPDGSSSNGFTWPTEGEVSAPDWDPKPECGNGLHGWLWGSGDASVASVGNLRDDALRWLVLEVRADAIVDLSGKVKFPACRVAFCGAREDAVSIVQRHAPNGVRVIFGQASAGNYGTASAGDYGTASAGYGGTASAGNYGTANAGEFGTANAGEFGTASAGEGGTIQVKRWDGKRYRTVVGYVGEDGIEANVRYRLGDADKFMKAVK